VISTPCTIIKSVGVMYLYLIVARGVLYVSGGRQLLYPKSHGVHARDIVVLFARRSVKSSQSGTNTQTLNKKLVKRWTTTTKAALSQSQTLLLLLLRSDASRGQKASLDM
jgi:hypothetical protein